MTETTKSTTSGKAGNILGWIGLILGVIAFFWQPVFLGIVAIVLGLIGVFSPKKVLNIITMVVGVVALIIGLA
ncbi:MAG: hypothetical protein QME45_09290 [Clostridiales bacterium]|nr:hypothetical protein [Clostridiales bacterium]